MPRLDEDLRRGRRIAGSSDTDTDAHTREYRRRGDTPDIGSRDLDALVSLFVNDVRVGREERGRDALRRNFEVQLSRIGVSILNVGPPRDVPERWDTWRAFEESG
jgi:hypothetical protein